MFLGFVILPFNMQKMKMSSQSLVTRKSLPGFPKIIPDFKKSLPSFPNSLPSFPKSIPDFPGSLFGKSGRLFKKLGRLFWKLEIEYDLGKQGERTMPRWNIEGLHTTKSFLSKRWASMSDHTTPPLIARIKTLKCWPVLLLHLQEAYRHINMFSKNKGTALYYNMFTSRKITSDWLLNW